MRKILYITVTFIASATLSALVTSNAMAASNSVYEITTYEPAYDKASGCYYTIIGDQHGQEKAFITDPKCLMPGESSRASDIAISKLDKLPLENSSKSN